MIAIILFSLTLILFVALGVSVIYALLIGYGIFFFYGVLNHYSPAVLFKRSIAGIKTVKNILIVFIFIGMITAVWRASGTIAIIIYTGAQLITPSVFLLLTFLLCAGLSVLFGTAFGTSATMGVVCISIARSMGINELYAGGAIISGVFFGDRCSPMSSCALLVSEVTRTDIFENIKGMVKTSFVPFVLTCIAYFFLGLQLESTGASADVASLFSTEYNLHITTVIPAILIIVLSLFKMRSRNTMMISIAAAVLIGIFVQHETPEAMFRYAVFGYRHHNEQLNALMRGGGIVSMIRVSIIISISSLYSGLFDEIGLLESLKRRLHRLGERITVFGSALVTSVITSAIACNQSLSVILTNELCKDMMNKKNMAITLANTAVLTSSLIPWSIGMAVPFQTIRVPNAAIFYGFYIYGVPLWNMITAVYRARKENKN